MSTNKFFLINTAGSHKNRNPSHAFFVGITLSPKFWRNDLSWSHVLIRTELSLQPRALLNSITDTFIRVFWNCCTKTLEKFIKMYVIEFSLNKIARLHSTVYSRIKNSTTNTFLEVLRKEKKFEDLNIFTKKPLQSIPFSLGSPVFRISDLTKTSQEKFFLWVF